MIIGPHQPAGRPRRATSAPEEDRPPRHQIMNIIVMITVYY